MERFSDFHKIKKTKRLEIVCLVYVTTTTLLRLFDPEDGFRKLPTAQRRDDKFNFRFVVCRKIYQHFKVYFISMLNLQ